MPDAPYRSAGSDAMVGTIHGAFSVLWPAAKTSIKMGPSRRCDRESAFIGQPVSAFQNPKLGPDQCFRNQDRY